MVQGEEVIPHPHGHRHSVEWLITVNIGFGFFCLVAFAIVTYIILAQKVQDLFVTVALRYLLAALFVRIIMCSLVGFKEKGDFLSAQNVPTQQLYFEIPFYMFVTVIMSFLFVWQHFYEIVLLTVEEDEVAGQEENDSFVNLDGDRTQSPRARDKRGFIIQEPLLDEDRRDTSDKESH